MRRLLCSWILIVVGMASGLAAADTVVFCTGDYPPYVYEAKPGSGAAAEIVAAACQAAGLDFEVRFMPWPRVEDQVRHGQAFAGFPYGITPERSREFDFSAPLYQVRNVIMRHVAVPAGSREPPARYSRLEDLVPWRVGVVSGLFIIPQLERAGIYYEPTATLDQTVMKLEAERIDLAIDDQGALFDAVKRLFPDRVAEFSLLNPPLDAQRPNCLLVSRSYPDAAALLKRFNTGLAAIKRNGVYDRIIAAYRLVPAP